jgi:Icc-related predicted phosphoesterase
MTHVNTILCVADPGGSQLAAERLRAAADEHEPDAIAVVGDLSAGGSADSYRLLLHALAATGLPAFWVPGRGDAPLDGYVREAHTVERAHPQLHGVHGTAALGPGGHLVFAGIGGEIDDDPGASRQEGDHLAYGRVEAEYRLRLLDEFPEHESVLLFWSPPARRGDGDRASAAVEELIKTHRPRLAVCGGERMTETLGKRSLVVAPGSLREGHFAIADLRRHEVDLIDLAVSPSA